MNYVIKRRRTLDKIKGLAVALGPNYGRRTWSKDDNEAEAEENKSKIRLRQDNNPTNYALINNSNNVLLSQASNGQPALRPSPSPPCRIRNVLADLSLFILIRCQRPSVRPAPFSRSGLIFFHLRKQMNIYEH